MQGITRYVSPTAFTDGAQAVCVDARGKVTLGAVIGNAAAIDQGPTSTCRAPALGVGLYGQAGDIVDGFGLRCNTFRGDHATNTDANYVGDPEGGGPQGPFDCPAGFELTGLEGTSADYFGRVELLSLTGVCSPRGTK